jgi:hypothetical protein
LARAKSAVILSDANWAKSQDDTDTDTWVCRTLIALREYESGARVHSLPVVAELQNPRNLALAQSAGASKIDRHADVTVGICSRSFGMRLLALESTKPGVYRVLETLVKTGQDSHELYPVTLDEA